MFGQMPAFIPGLKLSELFYQEAVRPILETDYPNLVYSAALIGLGSEVLGVDDRMSTDHHWGPRLMLFLGPEDLANEGARIAATLSARLPYRFRGYSTHFGPADEHGTRLLEEIDGGPISHRVEIFEPRAYFVHYLGIDPSAPISPVDWLSLPEQKLLSITRGAVFHDGLGQLDPLRAKLAYYPHDVWLLRLAAQWGRVSQEEPFVGRSGDAGDELGSRIIAARLVRDLMRLCFLMERRYAPYSKWFGTAFSELACAPELTPLFHGALSATSWQERETALCAAYEILARMHNRLGITEPLEPSVSPFYDRPYQVIHGDRFADALRAATSDETLQTIPFNVGGVDQFVDCVDITTNTRLHEKLTLALYWPDDWQETDE
jgi:hypothetical protein